MSTAPQPKPLDQRVNEFAGMSRVQWLTFVAQLEQHVTDISGERDSALMAVDMLAQRVNALEAKIDVLIQINQPRKAGPKPKDANNG